jgi:predicted porin
MNKKLIAAAIAAAVSAPAAFADVTVYGVVHMSVDSVDVDGGGYNGQTVNSRASRLGFKGSEDLGNGLKAVWKLEYALNADEPTNGLGGSARDHYLGLAGNFGTVLLAGRVNTPYKNSTGKMDFFGDTLADYNSTLGFEDQRANNAIAYISPKFSGLMFSAALVAGENQATGADGLADGYSMAVNYDNAGISGAIAYENLEDLGGTNEKFRVGLGYKMDAFKVAGVYENVDDVVGGVSAEADLWQISAAYTMGNNTIKAMYGQTEVELGGVSADGDAWAIGVDHKMSKRTSVYALYTDSEVGLHGESNKADYDLGDAGSGFSLGMVHKF